MLPLTVQVLFIALGVAVIVHFNGEVQESKTTALTVSRQPFASITITK